MDPHPLDQQGKRILEICKNMSLRILNGRVKGDENGKFTRYPKHSRENPSTIDYALCSTDTLQDVCKFLILPFTGLSDHCCVQLNISINSGPSNLKALETPMDCEETNHINPPLRRLKYDPDKREEFKTLLLENDDLKSLRMKLANAEIDQNEIDFCVSSINDVLTSSGRKIFHSGLPTRPTPKPKKKEM